MIIESSLIWIYGYIEIIWNKNKVRELILSVKAGFSTAKFCKSFKKKVDNEAIPKRRNSAEKKARFPEFKLKMILFKYNF